MQIMIRFLIFLLTLFFSIVSFSDACKKPYVLQVGPEFSSDFMVGYLGGFIFAVAQNIGCGARILGTKDYETFIKSALNNESNIYLIPEHFLPAFIKRGYIPVLQQEATSEMLFITSIKDIKQSDYGDTLQLILYTPSIYSIDYMLLGDWLKNTLNKTHIKHEFSHTYPFVVLKTMETPNTMGSIPSDLFTRLPNNIQDKMNTEKSGVFIGRYIVIHKSNRPELKQAIIHAKSHLISNFWTGDITLKESLYSMRVDSLIQTLEKSTK